MSIKYNFIKYIIFISLLSLLSISFLNILIVESELFQDGNELALGKATKSIYGKSKNGSIHCEGIKDSKKCINYANNFSSNILWIGNSQLHGINQYEEGQVPAPEILFNELESQGKNLTTFSMPNINYIEKYLLYKYLDMNLDIKTLLLPLVMDDFREGNLRSSFEELLYLDGFTSSLDADSLRELKNLKNSSSESDFDGLDGSFQDKAERFLDSELNKYSQLWEMRPKLRAAFFSILYKTRNKVFNITPSTERKIIPAIYKRNLLFLEKLFIEAKSSEKNILVYIVPIRNDVNIPYDLNEYKKFKKTAFDLTTKYGAVFLNLENLVEGKYWGEKDSTGLSNNNELDFMHFQFQGHKILSNKLSKSIANAKFEE